jgi:hypothetical protein
MPFTPETERMLEDARRDFLVKRALNPEERAKDPLLEKDLLERFLELSEEQKHAICKDPYWIERFPALDRQQGLPFPVRQEFIFFRRLEIRSKDTEDLMSDYIKQALRKLLYSRG